MYTVDEHGTKHELIVRLESVDISTEKVGMPGTLALRKCVNGMHEGAQKMIASKFAKGTLASPSIATAGGKLAFIYSIGFANFGGREVIIRGVHVSLMQNMSNTLHFLHERQKSGHPLLENQKVGDRNINYIVRVPDSNEAAMLKASMMNMASRTFGPENFDIVELIPHLAASKVNPDYHSTRDWIEPPHFGNIKACERCAKLSTMKGIRIKSCSSCHMVYFCSKECQRISWKRYHKNDCKAYALRAKGQQEECGQMKEIPKEVLKQNKKEEKQWKKKKEKDEELHNRDDEEYEVRGVVLGLIRKVLKHTLLILFIKKCTMYTIRSEVLSSSTLSLHTFITKPSLFFHFLMHLDVQIFHLPICNLLSICVLYSSPFFHRCFV